MEKIDVRIHETDEQGNVFTLLSPIVYEDLVIPAGFESDGASVPRFFWRCVFPPNDTRALRAAFIHDYVYRIHPKGWSKKKPTKHSTSSFVRTVSDTAPRNWHIGVFAGLASPHGTRAVMFSLRTSWS